MNGLKFIDILSVDDGLKDKVRCWRNKEEIRKFMLSQHLISREEHFRWLESLKQRTNQKFWIVFVNDIPIGSVYLQNIDHRQLTSEWGFYIGEENYRGKGIAKLILYKLLNLFFDAMQYETLFTKVLFSNTAALKIYKDFNFIEVSKSSDNNREISNLQFSKADWLKYKKDLKSVCS